MAKRHGDIDKERATFQSSHDAYARSIAYLSVVDLLVVPSSDIPESVKQLIAERIDSVPELETILLLREYREQQWTAAEAGQRLYVSTAVASHILSELTTRGFLSCGEATYRYAPATPELEATIDQLAEAYSHRLVEVTHMIHAKPSPSVRQFADAFRLRKDK